MRQKTENIIEFMETLGGLHDGVVTALQWLPNDHRFELAIKDLYANFSGLPEYPGLTPARFAFLAVSEFRMDICLTERGMLIYEWTIKSSGIGEYNSEIAFSPSGKISIACRVIEHDLHR